MSGALAEKLVETLPLVEPQSPDVADLQIADESTPVGASPARDMQAHLKTELEKSDKTSAREVTAMLLIVCVATWIVGVALYATL